MKRKNNDPPDVTAKWGWRYHHTGIPTDIKMNGERYLKEFKVL